MIFKFLIVLLACQVVVKLYSQEIQQDTVKLSVTDAEKTFLSKNLQLLTQKYNVDIADAMIVQARLYNNPTFSIAQGIDTKKGFDLSKTGETAIDLQQVILLARKRNKLILMQEANKQIAQFQFYDLLRTLKFTLRSDLYNLYFLQKSLSVYKKEIQSLTTIVKIYDEESQKGYIAKKEVLRLKAQLFSLESEQISLIGQINAVQAELNLMLHTTKAYYQPTIQLDAALTINPSDLNFQSMLDSAKLNRADLKSAKANIDYSQFNLNYQKALAVPDLTVGTTWDKNGSYAFNASLLTLSIDLPFFNRNQGNIQAAKVMIESSKVGYQSAEDKVATDLIQSYKTFSDNQKLYKQFDTQYIDDFNTMTEEVAKNYEKRNISLLDFLDFYDAFKQNTLQINTLQFNMLNAIETLNYSIGKDYILLKN